MGPISQPPKSSVIRESCYGCRECVYTYSTLYIHNTYLHTYIHTYIHTHINDKAFKQNALSAESAAAHNSVFGMMKKQCHYGTWLVTSLEYNIQHSFPISSNQKPGLSIIKLSGQVQVQVYFSDFPQLIWPGNVPCPYLSHQPPRLQRKLMSYSWLLPQRLWQVAMLSRREGGEGRRERESTWNAQRGSAELQTQTLQTASQTAI